MKTTVLNATLISLTLSTGAANLAAAEEPSKSLPYTPGLDVASMDNTADPCVDFYQYTCGGWMKNNPVPADQARWSVYGKLAQDNQRYLWGILEGMASKTSGRSARQAKLGDYFAACMNEEAIEKQGARPLAAELAQIAALKSIADLPSVLAKLQLATASSGFFFGFGSNQDFADSASVIAFATAGGLGLPDRDYYLKPEEKSQIIRDQYAAHIAKMLVLLGETEEVAKRDAASVLAIETALAKSSLSKVDKRDPYKIFHNMNGKELRALTPAFDWNQYLKAVGGGNFGKFNVTEPEFFKAFDGLLK